MKIGMQTWGVDGDIRPFCALAGGLVAAGHKVTLAVTSIDKKNYSEFANALGFEIHHVDVPFPDYTERQNRMINFILESTVNTPVQAFILAAKTFNPLVDDMFAISKKLASENDLLINYFVCHTLAAAAEAENKKWITIYPAPCYIQSSFIPPTTFPNINPVFTRIFWTLTRGFLNFLFLKHANRIRKQSGLPIIESTVHQLWKSPWLNIIASSPVICDRAEDWDENIQYSGFLNLPEKVQKWKMPKELTEFLARGEPPVFMTFGSFNKIGLNNNIKLFIKSIEKTGKRAIIQSYWSEATDFPDSENIYKTDSLPHAQIFPHCSLIVHHGGAGTIQTSLLYGLPSVVVSHGFDHTYFAKALERNHAGYKPLNKMFAGSSKIASGINYISQNQHFRKNAKKLGDGIRVEKGVKKAVEMIEDFIKNNVK